MLQHQMMASLKDRKNEYIDGDNIICQDGCDFSAYNSEYKKAKCECFAKESNLSFADMIINKTKLFDNLKDIRNLLNLNILICYKTLLSIISLNEIIHNIKRQNVNVLPKNQIYLFQI